MEVEAAVAAISNLSSRVEEAKAAEMINVEVEATAGEMINVNVEAEVAATATSNVSPAAAVRSNLARKFDMYAQLMRTVKGIQVVIFTDNKDLWRTGDHIGIKEDPLIPFPGEWASVKLRWLLLVFEELTNKYASDIPTNWLLHNTGTWKRPQLHLILGTTGMPRLMKNYLKPNTSS